MKTALQLEITFEQLLALVRQLPRNKKTAITEAIESDLISERLNKLLAAFKTDELDLDTIDAEVEAVRSELYARQIE